MSGSPVTRPIFFYGMSATTSFGVSKDIARTVTANRLAEEQALMGFRYISVSLLLVPNAKDTVLKLRREV